MPPRPARNADTAALPRLREALTYRIVSGEYPTGAQLPSYRELADEFGVSRTTVHKAVKDLQGEGYINVLPATGAFVSSSLPIRRSETELRADLERDISDLVRRAHLFGISREDLLEILSNRADEIYNPPESRVAFIECNRYDTESLTREVSRALQTPVTGVLLHELLANPDSYLSRFDTLITTYYHLSEVAESVGGIERVVPVHHRPSSASLLQVARIPRHQTVGVLATNERTRRSVTSTIEPYLAQPAISAALDDPEAVAEVLERADVVVDSLGAHPRVMRLGITAPVITIQFGLDPESIEQFRQRFGVRELQRT